MKAQRITLTKQMMRFILCMFLAGSISNSYAQSLDSLYKNIVSGKLSPAQKINAYKILVVGYVNDNPNLCIVYCKEAIALANKLNDPQAESFFLYYLGSGYYRNAVYDSASLYFDEALSIAKKNKILKSEASVYQAYGKLYRKQGQYDLAIDNYIKAVDICEKLNDEIELAAVYIGLGGTYQLMKNYDQALVYFKKAEQIAIEKNNRKLLSDIYISYVDIFSRREVEQDTVLFYAKQILQIEQEIGSTYGEINALQTVANSYFFYDDYKNARIYAREAVLLSEQINNSNLKAFSLMILSNIYFYEQRYSESVKHALLARENDSTDYNLNLNIYSRLASAYAHLGKPDSVTIYMDLAQEILADHSNISYQRSLSEMEVKYETDKKSIQIAALSKQKSLYLWLGIIGGLMLLAALAFVIVRYRLAVNKRKLADEKSQRLERESQLMAVQATLDGESAERSRLAKDLHDGLGSMLSLVKFNMPQVNGGAVLEEGEVSKFRKALDMLDDSIQELRRVAHHMMPESLLRYGLRNSLSDFCAAIPIAKFHYFGDEARLPGNLEIMIYRSIHELVNNVLKHADARQINVQLLQEDDRISFTVQDDGKGFDPQAVKEGMGLKNIRQRVAAFQGKMEIYSSKEGTEIHVELELNKK